MFGDNTKDFLGQGFSFPLALDHTTGRFVPVSAEEDIRQAVYLVIMTKRGERAMMPEFGCDVHNYVFELPDAAFETLLREEIVRALTMWEPRIMDINVRVDNRELKDGRLAVAIDYTVRATNTPQNLVFPYYLYEGAGEL